MFPQVKKPHPRIPFFRIVYSGTFTLFALILIALMLVMLGDHIFQSIRAGRIYNVVIVAGVYVLTMLAAILIYASRLFTTRSSLASIPRQLQLDHNRRKGLGLGMGRSMEASVREQLDRSAIIGFESTPRDLSHETKQKIVPAYPTLRETNISEETSRTPTNHGKVPFWGLVSHPGYSSPEASDIPSVRYDDVIIELGNLIEAKAVSLAPVNEKSLVDSNEWAVDLLKRPSSMSLKAYVNHLDKLGMITVAKIRVEFVALYESARFRGSPLVEAEFRTLMASFASFLDGLRSPPADLVRKLRETQRSSRSDANSGSPPTSASSNNQRRQQSGSSSHRESRPASASDHSTEDLSRIQSHIARNKASSRISSSSSSVKSSAGSVIRLSGAADSHGLPYTFTT